MYKIRDFEKLEELGLKKNINGYSKKVIGRDYDFLDITFDDKIVKKVKYSNGHFIYKNAEADDIRDLIKNKTVRKIADGTTKVSTKD